MRPMLIGAPAIEPVSLAEAKSWLREDASDEDQLIQALIVSARMTLEAYTRRFFITQSWRLVYDAWPRSADTQSSLFIPFAPFQSIVAVRVFDAHGVGADIDAATYRAPASDDGGRVTFLAAPPHSSRKADGIEVDFTVGYGDLVNETPEPLRRAIMILVAHWREKRGDDANDALPNAVMQLAASFRRRRLA
ncbi:MAG TPA: phage head-tail connector protein [Methylocystis sp.]